MMEQPEPTPWRDMVVVSLVREGIDKHKARELADHFAAPPQQQAEPTCPECKAKVLFECVACSSNNYPTQQQAEPVQKLVAWGVFDGNLHDMFFTEEEAQEMVRLKGDGSTVAPLYTTPPQRTWVGLTPEEVKHLYPYGRSVWGRETFEAIEKALKGKNT